jgi:zinc protease
MKALNLISAILFFFYLPLSSQQDNKRLSVDPSLQQGTFPNGLRYIIQENVMPAGKVEIYLHIGSGSIDEEDNQQGLAHFLEHMAFNGSKNFPAGTLVKYFESMGLTFGMHQNAFTSFDQTTYILSLPNINDETLDKGVLCMADFAYGLDLNLQEIDKERGVIQEENRARTSVRQRIMNTMLPVLLPGSRAAHRLPIGKMDIIQKATRENFVDFYEKWYHPENAVVMVVGDIKAAAVEKLLAKHFLGWKKKTQAPEHLPTGIKPYTKDNSYVVADAELTEASVSLTSIRSMRPIKTEGDYRRELIADLGQWVMNRRLGDLVKSGQASFLSASASASSFLNVSTYINASAEGKVENWKEMLEQLVKEVKRARVYGFNQQEVDDGIKTFLAMADRAVATAETRKSKSIINELNTAVSEGHLPMSAKQEQELLVKILPSVTITEINDIFGKMFSAENRLAVLELPASPVLPTKERLMEVVLRAEKVEVTPYETKKRVEGLLSQELKAGEIKQQTLHEATGVTTVELANGVIFHQKSMAFNKDSVIVRLNFQGGKIEETESNRGISDLAILPLHQPASKSFSSIDIRNMMVGKNVSVRSSAGSDGMNIVISGSNEDLEEGFKLAYHLINEAKIEEPIFNNTTQQITQALSQMKNSVDMQLMDSMERIITDNDPRFGMINEEQLAKLTMVDTQKWLERILLEAPIEASIVGDIDKDKAIALMQKYFGSLPVRHSFSHIAKLREIKIKRVGVDKEIKVDTKTPKSLVMVGWRGPEYKEKKKRRTMTVAAKILGSRLHEEIRENHQLTYSAFCQSQSEPAFTNKSIVFAYFTADKAKARQAAVLCKKLMIHFARKGPSEEEVKTAKKQFATTIKSMLEKPAYWSGILSELNLRQNSLDDLANIESIYQSIGRDDIRQTVKEYFTTKNNITIVVLPKK